MRRLERVKQVFLYSSIMLNITDPTYFDYPSSDVILKAGKIHCILTIKLNGLKWSHRTRSTSPFTAQSLCESSTRQSNTRVNLKPFHNLIQNSTNTRQLRANVHGVEECCDYLKYGLEMCKDQILQIKFLF